MYPMYYVQKFPFQILQVYSNCVCVWGGYECVSAFVFAANCEVMHEYIQYNCGDTANCVAPQLRSPHFHYNGYLYGGGREDGEKKMCRCGLGSNLETTTCLVRVASCRPLKLLRQASLSVPKDCLG